MRTVGFTRPEERLEDSVKLAESLGMNVLAAPSLSILPGTDAEFERLESLLASHPVLVFGSLTAAEMCGKRYGDGFAQMVRGCRIVSIGPATTAGLARLGVGAEEPDEFSSDGIVRLLAGDAEGRLFVLVRSDSGSDVQTEGLARAGGRVESIAAYRLKPVSMCPRLKRLMGAVADGTLDAMAFTSPLSARSFIGAMRTEYGRDAADAMLRRIRKAAIGKPTADALVSEGHPPDIVPDKTTFEDMLIAVRDSRRCRWNDLMPFTDEDRMCGDPESELLEEIERGESNRLGLESDLPDDRSSPSRPPEAASCSAHPMIARSSAYPMTGSTSSGMR